jgi:RNA polymerase sigma factor (sigma-70 family)
MLGSTEDAEDVLQEVFAASFNAMIADSRPINARPWLYRIARNRCLNHLRRPQHAGQDSMDIFESGAGITTADAVHKREEFRQIVSDVQDLPETQKTALLLREIDALSYEQIAEAMETTVPSVKSLLVRARVSLAEAAEARLLTCEEVRLELGQVAEGLGKTTAPVRRHLKQCDRCKVFKGELKKANRALAAVYPLGTVVLFKKFFIAKLGFAGGGVSATSASGTAASGAGGAMFGGAAATAGASAGGAFSAGMGAIASKAAAGLAAAALVTAGAVESKHALDPSSTHSNNAQAQVAAAPQVARQAPVPAQVATPAAAKPAVVAKADPPAAAEDAKADARAKDEAEDVKPTVDPAVTLPTEPVAVPTPTDTPAAPVVDPVQEEGSTVVIEPTTGMNDDPSTGSGSEWDEPGTGSGSGSGNTGSGTTTGEPSTQPGAGAGSTQSPPPGESSNTPGASQPAPVAGEREPSTIKKIVRRLAGKPSSK